MLVYTDLIHDVVRDMAEHLRDFAHLDPDRIGVLAAARCSRHTTGNLALCIGLVEDAAPGFSVWVRSRTPQVEAVSGWFRRAAPVVRLGGHEMDYLILLRLPRMLEHNPLETLVHELYHIAPRFDRRLRNTRHGPHFDREVRRIARTWLRDRPGELARHMGMSLAELLEAHGSIVARGVPAGFTLPLVRAADPPEPYESAMRRLYPGYRLCPGYQVRPAALSPESAPDLIAEGDLTLRQFDGRGSTALPASYLAYSRRLAAQRRAPG